MANNFEKLETLQAGIRLEGRELPVGTVVELPTGIATHWKQRGLAKVYVDDKGKGKEEEKKGEEPEKKTEPPIETAGKKEKPEKAVRRE